MAQRRPSDGQPVMDTPWAASGYLTEAEAADYIRTPAETLRKWRRLGTGPLSVKMPNGTVFYPQHLLDAWKAQRIEEAMAEAEARRPGPGRGRRRRPAGVSKVTDGPRAIPA